MFLISQFDTESAFNGKTQNQKASKNFFLKEKRGVGRRVLGGNKRPTLIYLFIFNRNDPLSFIFSPLKKKKTEFTHLWPDRDCWITESYNLWSVTLQTFKIVQVCLGSCSIYIYSPAYNVNWQVEACNAITSAQTRCLLSISSPVPSAQVRHTLKTCHVRLYLLYILKDYVLMLLLAQN